MEGEGKLEKFMEHIKEYAEVKVDLMALNIQDKTSDVVSSIASALVFVLLTMTILLFLSIGMAWWLGQLFGGLSIGFFCVAGFYLFLGIIIYFFRAQWIKMPIINFLLKKINLNEEG